MDAAPPSPPASITTATPHAYGTRIRKNTSLKPSARFRNLSDPLSSQQLNSKPILRSLQHNSYPQFPLPGIVLHPDDTNNKVLMAIGRSFLSVDNRAMTIKDLADMTVKFGLVCQNVSAASQAITTYIRTHIQRCEVQQDQPLLLRHVLSGTAADDDLLPALYSRSGGAHLNISPENKITNFRRGTMVWYLSRSTGAPCPFTRAGIRLSQYAEDGRIGHVGLLKERFSDKGRIPEQCGQKRKRSLRNCVARRDSDSESQIDECPPPKVKLTLRLRPLHRTSPSSDVTSSASPTAVDLSKESDSESSDSSDDAMSVDSNFESENGKETRSTSAAEEALWSLPPYPRRTISIPCYKPSAEFSSYTPYSNVECFRLPSSGPNSIGSPPPDSEDEDEDFHITMTGARRQPVDPHSSVDNFDLGWDADLDSEGDADTTSEGPGPWSPYVQLMQPEVLVKEEPNDLQSMLDAWEDFDYSVAGAKVAELIARAAACALESQKLSEVKMESHDPISSSTDQNLRLPSEVMTTHIKQEEVDLDSPFLLHNDIFSTVTASPLSPSSHLPGLSYSPSPSPESSHDDEWMQGSKYLAPIQTSMKNSSPSLPLAPTPSFAFPYLSHCNPSVPHLSRPPTSCPSSISQSLAALIQTMSMNSPTTVVSSALDLPMPCISPLDTRCKSLSPDPIVVQTCQPCDPPIIATHLEGISVYQMALGPYLLLRRIDTDFVNLTSIVEHSNASHPVISTISNAVTVNKGSPAVLGTWVPLTAAQAYLRDHPGLHNGPYDIFLSNALPERFPTALREFNKSNPCGRTLNHFGPHFGSTLQAIRLSSQCEPQESEARTNSVIESLGLPLSLEPTFRDMTCPLNAEEQEIFREICDVPDSDKENSRPASPEITIVDESESSRPVEVPSIEETLREPIGSTGDGERIRPLRRSKRVADSIAAQTRSRTRRGGSRNSLS